MVETSKAIAVLKAELACSLCDDGEDIQMMRDPLSIKCCGHSFCRDCIEDFVDKNKSCPNCFVDAVPKDIRQIDHQIVDAAAEVKILEELVAACLLSSKGRSLPASQSQLSRMNSSFSGSEEPRRVHAERKPVRSKVEERSASMLTEEVDSQESKGTDYFTPKDERQKRANQKETQKTYKVKRGKALRDAEQIPKVAAWADEVAATMADSNSDTNPRQEQQAPTSKEKEPDFEIDILDQIGDVESESEATINVKQAQSPIVDPAWNQASSRRSTRKSTEKIESPRKTKLARTNVLTTSTNFHGRTNNAKKTTTVTKRTTPVVIDKKNSKGETPLHRAAIRGKLEEVKELAAAGANINTKDHDRWTPLHEVCSRGFVDLSQFLIENGADVNAAGGSESNTTPLHDAVEHGHVSVVKLLLNHGADPTIKDLHDKIPRDYTNNQFILDALEEYTSAKPVKMRKKRIASSGAPQDIDTVTVLRRRPVVTLSGLTSQKKAEMSKMLGSLGVQLSDNYSKQVSHVVVNVDANGVCKRTIKYLKGVANGCWIVTQEWIVDSSRNKVSAPEHEFEAKGDMYSSWGPRKSRQNTSLQNPKLFDGCHFFLNGNFDAKGMVSKSDMSQLITMAGGQVMNREPITNQELTICPYHWPRGKRLPLSYFIVSEGLQTSSRRRGDSKAADITQELLLRSISNFSIPIPER